MDEELKHRVIQARLDATAARLRIAESRLEVCLGRELMRTHEGDREMRKRDILKEHNKH